MIQPNTVCDTPITRKLLVVIGNGMAGARFIEDLIGLDPSHAFDISIFGDKPYGNYNRILLPNVLNGSQDAKEIFLNPLAWYAENDVTFHAGKKVTKIDREAKIAYADGVEEAYDTLVFATGSRPFVPPIAGTSLHGVFVFRTLDDCRNIADYAKDCKKAVVIGGGLLGLEAAKGLMTHDANVTVVDICPWLMGAQLDSDGGKVPQQTIEKLGITALTWASTKEFVGDETNRVKGVKFADGSIEHRLFSQISASWAGHVLSTLLILLGFVRRTTTETGLKVTATHIDRTYQTGLKVSQSEFEAIRLTRHEICPQWNYTIRPNLKNTE